MVKNLPTVRETQVLSLNQEDPLEKGMATDFNILAWSAGAGLGDTPALLPAEMPSGASPASTPRRCWNDCSQRVAPSSTHSPGSAPVGKAGRPSGKAGSSRALRAVQSRHSLGVCCY